MQNLIPYFILEKYAAGESGGRFDAVGLFADISGFSTVTTTLMQHGSEAAEAMADVMLAVFTPLVEAVYAHGGLITTFAGDAFTALFPLTHDRPRAYWRALAAAVRVQGHLAAHPTQRTPYGEFPFAIKLGLADGAVEWGILSPTAEVAAGAEHEVKAAYFFSGPAVDGAAAAEHYAQSGDLIASATVHEVLGTGVTTEPVGEEGAGYVRVTAVGAPLPAPQPVDQTHPHAEHMAAFIPATIRELGARGEFRLVVSVFVKLMGIDTTQQLSYFMQSVFALQRRYGGYLNRVDFGDKGCNLLLFWGMPTSYENDIERALDFLLEIPNITPGTFKGGVTYQPMYAGLSGSTLRGEFTGYGGGVTFAARLMMAAPWGTVWLSEAVARRAGPRFAVEYEGHHPFKGFAEDQPVYALFERRDEGPAGLFQGAMVGREAELAQLREFVQPLLEHRCAGILVVSGAAGLGKSRLVHEFVARLTDASAHPSSHPPDSPSPTPSPQHFLCQTDQILRQSLNPFRYWLRGYFEQSAAQSEARNKRAFSRKLDQLIATTPNPELGRELNRTRSFLGAVVDLFWEQSLYAELDAQGRFENTLIALKTLVQAECLCRPVIVHIEDAHWLDEDSMAFVQHLVRDAAAYPLVIIATARPEREGVLFGGGQAYEVLDLDVLSGEHLGLLAAGLLGMPPSPALVRLLAARAEGNPFFAEQLVLYLREQGLLDGGELLAVPGTALPTDVRAVLIARLDRLAREVKDVVQRAAILGREFEVQVLSQMLRGDPATLDRVAAAAEAAVWSALSELRYLFKHALLRDTAYGMQLRARRRELHRLAAEALETLYAADLSPYYAEIAYHYEAAYQQGLGEVREPACAYLRLAGERAAARYENTAAVDLFSRALALTEEAGVRYELLLGREAVYHWQGNRAAQVGDLDALAALVQARQCPGEQSEVALRRAWYAEATGDYPGVIAAAQAAISLAEAVPDRRNEAAGYLWWGVALWHQGEHGEARAQLARALDRSRSAGLRRVEADSLRNLGIVLHRQGDYDAARAHLAQALGIYQEVGDRVGENKALTELGNVSYEQGDHAGATVYYERALHICREIGDRRREGVVLLNLSVLSDEQGDYAHAVACFERNLRICREVGDRLSEGHALNNLGFVAMSQGDGNGAWSYFEQALAIHRELGNRRDESSTLSNLSLLAHQQGDDQAAREHGQQALLIAQEVGDRSTEGEVWTHLGHALAGLGQLDEAVAAYRQGLVIRRELGEQTLAMETLAGLARVSLTRGDQVPAQSQVEEVLAYLEGNTLDGAYEPLRVYLTCYQVLKANEDPRAQETLAAAYDLLQERAARIGDEELRRSFLENVAAHREIVSEWMERA